MRMRQILVNLVGNAIKFTETGEVFVTLKAKPLGDGATGRSELCFEIRDTGIGIAAEKQGAIFQAFSQADTSSTRRYGGTGLGLTICKRLVELMGGQIGVQSEPGLGSTFWFTVPVGSGPAEAAPTCADLSRLAGVPVLVVDDNNTNRRLLADWLSRWGMWPIVAPSGPAAIRLLESLVEPVPLILTDVHMPEMDGFDLLKYIKQHLQSATIIMLTSGTYPGDIARSRELGAEAHMLKPVRQQDLLRAIQQVFKDRPEMPRVTSNSQGSIRQLASQVGGERKLRAAPKVLVVEDNINNQYVARGLLTKHGYAVNVVGDGREAVRAHERESFDLVLMDIQMPDMDGFEATRRIRAREKFTDEHTPIIAMTAHAMTGDREKCLEAGMDGYVAKPIRPAELAAAITHAVERPGDPQTLTR
jgi:CheY-like chemotaxis protein